MANLEGGIALENNTLISQATCRTWFKYFENHNVFYLHAMTGYGKTAQSKVFAQRYFDIYRIYNAGRKDIFKSIEVMFLKCEKTIEKKLLIIDNVHKITNKTTQKKLSNLLTSKFLEHNNIKIMLLSTAPLPEYLFPLKLSNTIAVEDKKTLKIKAQQIASYIISNDSFDSLNESDVKRHINKCIEFSEGYPVAVILYLQRLAEKVYNADTVLDFTRNDLYSYFDTVTKELSKKELELLLHLSVFNTFTLDMVKEINKNITKADLIPLLDYGFLEPVSQSSFKIESNLYHYLQGKLVKTDLFDPKIVLEIAGNIYEAKRNMEAALHCYSLAENYEKIENIVIYLSENADGCEFAEICDEYIGKLSLDQEQKNPRLLGAKALIQAYALKKNEFDKYMQQLKKLAYDEKNKTASEVYMRTLIACPISNSDNLKENLVLFSEYVIKTGASFKFITPTGNMPSLLNGGLDLLPWSKSNKVFHTMMNKVVKAVIGYEAIGAYNTIIGELHYEHNKKTEAIDSLAKALDEANREGSIRMQYTVVAIMARLYCTENDHEKALEVLNQFYKKAEKENYFEILPNIVASMVQLSLLTNRATFCNTWLEKQAPNEHKKFYLTQRHVLFTKAKVYVSLGKYIDALHIISVLERYTLIAERRYFAAQLHILKAIILYRRGEEYEEQLFRALKITYEYKLIRILADEGVALLPILKEMFNKQHYFDPEYIAIIERETSKMAELYPNYLKPLQRNRGLTKKEMSILHLLAQGRKNEEMAKELSIALPTVKFHISNIMNKFEVKNRASILKVAHEENIL